jgi:hypothetical protein
VHPPLSAAVPILLIFRRLKRLFPKSRRSYAALEPKPVKLSMKLLNILLQLLLPMTQKAGSATVVTRYLIFPTRKSPKAHQAKGINLFANRCNGSLLTRVRKSCKGRAVLPNPAHQVTAEAQEVGAVRTKPSNSAAA